MSWHGAAATAAIVLRRKLNHSATNHGIHMAVGRLLHKRPLHFWPHALQKVLQQGQLIWRWQRFAAAFAGAAMPRAPRAEEALKERPALLADGLLGYCQLPLNCVPLLCCLGRLREALLLSGAGDVRAHACRQGGEAGQVEACPPSVLPLPASNAAASEHS